MANLLEKFERSFMTKKLPEIKPGDRIKVFHKIKEGDKFKVQVFEGMVIAKKGELSRLRITVRKIGAGGIGVEKTFFLYHPLVSKIEILKRAKTRRAKLYYLRRVKGKKASKLKEKHPELSDLLIWEEKELKEEAEEVEEEKETPKEESAEKNKEEKEKKKEKKQEKNIKEESNSEKSQENSPPSQS